MHLSIDRGRLRTAPPADADVGPDAARATALLRALPLFDGVRLDAGPPPFEDALVERRTAGARLFEAGEPAAALYVVVAGRVRLVLDGATGRRVLATLGRGDTVGLAALLRGDVYPVGAEVVDDATLVALPADAVRGLIERHPAIAARLVGDMGAKLARVVRDLGGFAQHSARARVAGLLRELARGAPAGTEGIDFGESKRAIAARLAMTPETLSRELHALAVRGVIESRRTRFAVLDPDGLARAADAVDGPRAS